MEEIIKNKLGFELVTCTRCGGSGHYSYCQAHGTMCFKCGGSGVVLSKKGAATKAFFRSSLQKSVYDISVGDKIRTDRRWEVVESIEKDELNGGLMIRVGSYTQLACTGTMQSIKTGDEFKERLAAALEFQTKLTKAGKLMKKYQDKEIKEETRIKNLLIPLAQSPDAAKALKSALQITAGDE